MKNKKLNFEKLTFNQLSEKYQKSFLDKLKFLHFISRITRHSFLDIVKGDDAHTYVLVAYRKRGSDTNKRIFIKDVEGNFFKITVSYSFCDERSEDLLHIKNTDYLYALVKIEQGLNLNGTLETIEVK